MFRTFSILLFFIFSCQLNVFGQWKKIYTGTNADLYDVEIIGNKVFVCGQDSTVLFSNDTGKTWTRIKGLIRGHYRTLHFFDSSTGLVSGENARVQKTINHGTNWNQKYIRTAAYAYDMAFDQDSGFLVGKDFLIASSSDKGENWSVDTTADIRKQLNCGAISPIHKCWAVGDSGYILSKYLWEKKWNILKFPSTINFTSVNAINDSTVVIVGGMQDTANVGKHFNIILYSLDNGNSWSNAFATEMKTIYSSSFLNNDTGFLAGTNGIISKVYHPISKRGQQITGVSSGLNRIVCNSYVAIAVGDGGTLLRTRNRGGFGVGINDININAKIKIYPQPSSSNLFHYSSPEGYELKSLHDMNGRILSYNLDGNQVELLENYKGFAVITFADQEGHFSCSIISFN